MNKNVNRILLSAAFVFAGLYCNNQAQAQYSSSNPFRIGMDNGFNENQPGNPEGVSPAAAYWYDVGDWQNFMINANVLVNGQPMPSNYPNNVFDATTQAYTKAWQQGNMTAGTYSAGKVDANTYSASGLGNPQILSPYHIGFGAPTDCEFSIKQDPNHPRGPWTPTLFDASFRKDMGYGHGPHLPTRRPGDKPSNRLTWDDVLQWQDFLKRCFKDPLMGNAYPNGTFDIATETATKHFQDKAYPISGNGMYPNMDKIGGMDPTDPNKINGGILLATGGLDECTFQKALSVIFMTSLAQQKAGYIVCPMPVPPKPLTTHCYNSWAKVSGGN